MTYVMIPAEDRLRTRFGLSVTSWPLFAYNIMIAGQFS